MGQNNLHSHNSHVSMPNNWQQHAQDPNVIVNRLTRQQLQRNHIKIPMKKLTKQAALFFTRMGNIHQHVCRLYYYHYTGYESPGMLDPNKENRNLCAYTDRMLKLKSQNWNKQNMVSALEGFQQLTDLYGPFKITETMIGQNQRGQIRVWINSNPAQNRPEGFCNNEEESIASFAGLLSHKNKSLANSIIGCGSYREASQRLKNCDQERSLSLKEVAQHPSENINKKQKNSTKQDKGSPPRNVLGAINRLNIQQDGWPNSPLKGYDPQKKIGSNETTALKPEPMSNFLKSRNKIQSCLTVEASPNHKVEHKSTDQIKIQQKSKINLPKNAATIEPVFLEKRSKIKNQSVYNEYLQNTSFDRDHLQNRKYNPLFTEGISHFHSTFTKNQQWKNHSHHPYGPNIAREQPRPVSNKAKKKKQPTGNRKGLQNASDFFTFHQITSKLGSPACSDTSAEKQRNGKIPFFIKVKSQQHKYSQYKFAPSTQTPDISITINKSSNHPNHPESNRGNRALTHLNKSTLDLQNLLQREGFSKNQSRPSPVCRVDYSVEKDHEEVIHNRMSEGPVDSYKPRIFQNYNKPAAKNEHITKTSPPQISANKTINHLQPHGYGSKGPDYNMCKINNRTQTNEFWEKSKQNRNAILEQKTKKPIISSIKVKNDTAEQIPTTKSIQIPVQSQQHLETSLKETKICSNIKRQIQSQFVSLFGELRQTIEKKKNPPPSSSEQDHPAKLTESQVMLKKKIKMKQMQFAELKKQALLVLAAK